MRNVVFRIDGRRIPVECPGPSILDTPAARAEANIALPESAAQTRGITALSPDDQSAIREKMETFGAFTPDIKRNAAVPRSAPITSRTQHADANPWGCTSR